MDTVNTLLALGEANREHKWREEDIIYRGLVNKQFMLGQKDRVVDLRIKDLNTTSNHSALMAGFTIVMFVELQVDPTTPTGLIVAYGGVTALVCCLFALTMIQTMLIQTTISQRSQMMNNKKEFNNFWRGRCDEKWRQTYKCFSYACFLFFLNIALVGWVKFWDTPAAPAVITGIVIISIFVWLIDYCFWGTYVANMIEFKNTAPGTSGSDNDNQGIVLNRFANDGENKV
jgi:preprotein translocase subunit SecE|tara:strand:- start:1377 stop:2066 length:690 start_codon:yes stop_codon:yes gene_type:complete